MPVSYTHLVAHVVHGCEPQRERPELLHQGDEQQVRCSLLQDDDREQGDLGAADDSPGGVLHGVVEMCIRDRVCSVFGPGNANGFDINFICVDARERYFAKLAGVTEPERKRKICLLYTSRCV